MAKRSLPDLRVMVTGASSGIGFALSKQLLHIGCRVLATARRAEELEKLRSEHLAPSQLQLVSGDICDARHRQNLLDRCCQAWDGLDILINNAGVGSLGSFEESSEAVIRQVMEVNFFAPVEMIRLALPHLRKGKTPLIANVSSVLGHRGVPLKSEYCASKFAMHGFSDSLRAELGRDVDLLLVSPSTTRSDFFQNAIEDHSQRDWTPRKAMTPEKVAAKTIKAMTAGKHEVILSLGGKGLVLMDRLAPSFTNRIIARFG